MNAAIKICAIVACELLISCSLPQANYVEVGNDKSYEQLNGAEYVSTTQLEKVGVTDSDNYEKKVDYYLVVKRPGFRGPEVVSRVVLPSGTKFKVLKVLKCTNCLSESIRVLISLDDMPEVPQTYISGLVVRKTDGSFVIRDLDQGAFKRTNSTSARGH